MALAVSVCVVGCRRSPLDECTRLEKAKRDVEAAACCARAYEQTGQPRAGLLAAWAEYRLGHQTEVEAWTERLKGTPEEATCWSMVATLRRDQGQVDQAQDAYRRAIDLHRAAGRHSEATHNLNGLVHLFWQTSKLREALLAAREALDEAALCGDSEAATDTAQRLFATLYDVGDLEGAELALRLVEGSAARGSGLDRAVTLAQWCVLHLGQGRLELASDACRRALDMASGESAPTFFRATHLNLVEIHLKLDQHQLARQHLGAAWRYAEARGPSRCVLLYHRALVELGSRRYDAAQAAISDALGADPPRDWLWELEYRQGLIAEAKGDLQAAEAAYERAARIVEELRATLAFDEFKAWALDHKRQPLEALFGLQARDPRRASDALATLERTKARTLADAFVRGTSEASAPTSEAAKWDPEPTLARVETLQRLLSRLGESPVMELRPVETLLRRLAGRDLLAYFQTGDRVWLVRVGRGRVKARPLDVTAATLRLAVERFVGHPEDAAVAGELGGLLLPLVEMPPRGAPLWIVTDGPLDILPFAALRVQGRFLVEDHALAHVPSLNALVALEERPGAGGGPATVIGDPTGDLPAAAAEAGRVAAGLGVTAHVQGQATSGRLLAARCARVLHLAVHTRPGPRGPELLLADGSVGAETIVASGVGPSLVVLATCSSAAPRGRVAWGTLPHAFLAGGTESVLGALWSVEDQATRSFFDRFYAEGGVEDPMAALARTQRHLIAEGESPSAWAPFVLVGSGRRPRRHQGESDEDALEDCDGRRGGGSGFRRSRPGSPEGPARQVGGAGRGRRRERTSRGQGSSRRPQARRRFAAYSLCDGGARPAFPLQVRPESE